MLIFLLPLLSIVQIATSQTIEQVEGLRASYEQKDGSIRVEWNSRPHRSEVPFLIRYRLVGIEGWTYQRSRGNSQKLDIPNIRNNDQIEVQVRTDERTNDHWSQPLLITVNKKIVVDGIALTDGDLFPPLDFKATIKDSHSVKIQWQPADPDPEIFYLVQVKQITSKKGAPLHRQQIKTAATSFELGGLEGGARYELAVRSALPERISQTASVVEIKLPLDEEFFEIGNLMIASKFMSDGRGTVNLTWSVPRHMKHRITAYDVKYTEKNANRWRRVNFGGERPKATLHDLSSDTEYQLEIKTKLDNGHNSETTHFTFRTPKVETNPIDKVDVLFSHDVNTVQVQWILKDDMDVSQVIGYDVYLSENLDAPPHTWQRMHVDNQEGSLAIPGLRSLSTYFVRIDVRTRDGKVVRAPSIYKFTTIGTESTDDNTANMLSYMNVAPGEVILSWTFPEYLRHLVKGSLLLYTHDKEVPQEQWKRVDIEGGSGKSVHLQQLHMGRTYQVRIIPRLHDDRYAPQFAETLEMHVDAVTMRTGGNGPRDPLQLGVALPPRRRARYSK